MGMGITRIRPDLPTDQHYSTYLTYETYPKYKTRKHDVQACDESVTVRRFVNFARLHIGSGLADHDLAPCFGKIW